MPDIRVEVLLDAAERRRALEDDVRLGLASTPRRLTPTLLYDEEGSRLFDEITRLPEYYLTRCEREILVERAAEIAGVSQAETLVELGSGTSEKTRILLDALHAGGTLRRFAPIDVSEETLRASAELVAAEYPELGVHAVVGDFARHLDAPLGGGRTLIAFLGSTLGNLEPAGRASFLETVSDALGPDDGFLIGLDLVKDPVIIEAAYNDSAGVSERFQRNGLAHLDREFGSDFAGAGFAYLARWDSRNEWVDLGFLSVGEQVLHVPALDVDVSFADGERLRIEISSKFTRVGVESELRAAGLDVAAWWEDANGSFALCLAIPLA